MKIYSNQAFRQAQDAARYAVEEGSKSGADLDWDAGMILLRVAYGYARIEYAENYYGDNDGS